MDGRGGASGVRRWATSFGHGSNLGAIYTTAWERDPELSHVDYRSADDASATHRAGVELPVPAALAAARILWTPGQEPRAFRLLGRRAPDGPLEPLGGDGARAADGRVSEIDLSGEPPLAGLAVELLPGGGHPASPGTLAIRALALRPAVPGVASIAVVRAGGAIEEPATPFPHPALPGLVLDLGLAAGLMVTVPGAATEAVLALHFVRLGATGTAADLASLAATLRVPADRDVRIALAESATSVVAGTTALLLRFSSAPGEAAAPGPLRIDFAEEPALLGLAGAEWLHGAAAVALWRLGRPPAPPPPEDPAVERAAEEIRTAPTDVLGERLRAGGTYDLAAARALVTSPRHAATLGLPGTDARAGVSPDGTLQLPVPPAAAHGGSVSACLHVGFALAGHPAPPPERILQNPGPGPLSLVWSPPGLHLAVTCTIDPTGGALCAGVLVSSLEGGPVGLRVGLALRDWLTPLPLDLRVASAGALAWPDGRVAVQHPDLEVTLPAELGGELVLAHDFVLPERGTRRFDLRFCIGDVGEDERLAAGGAGVSGGATGAEISTRDGGRHSSGPLRGPDAGIDFQLPDPTWDGLARDLQRQAFLFRRADGTMPYGLYPSVYDGDVYGLEEDFAFYGLALWGHVGRALDAFRATYLTDDHLSKKHYLHDLRNGLTPWQAARLAALAGTREFLDDDARLRLKACGEWAARERRRAIPGAVPGLLPPFRYGGDLDFPTQSLFANAANVSGVRALADLLPAESDAWRAEAADYRRVLLDAFDAVRTTDAKSGLTLVPLHTGAGDPGDYYQLMVCGILETYEFFAPEDPRLVAMHDYLERTGRLCLALPRFDGWGTAGFGIDAHYAVGYLLNALREGSAERRAIFWTGLLGLATAAMDPDVLTFREVGPLLLPGARAAIATHVPGRHLGLTEPCIGGPGVMLQLLRHSLLSEALDAEGRPGRTIRVLPAPLPSWWAGGDFHLTEAPTNGGPVSLAVENRLAASGDVHVSLEGAGVDGFDVLAPDPPGWALVAGEPRVRAPAGSHRFSWRFRRAAAGEPA